MAMTQEQRKAIEARVEQLEKLLLAAWPRQGAGSFDQWAELNREWNELELLLHDDDVARGTAS